MRQLLVAVVLVIFYSDPIASETKYWQTPNATNLIGSLKDTLTGGIAEGDGLTWMVYVCRSKPNSWSTWKVGVLSVWYGEVTCCVNQDAQVCLKIKPDTVENIQVLVIHPGCVTWVPVKPGDELPADRVTGGVLESDDAAPVCRVLVDDHVRIGTYHKTTSECFFTWYGAKKQQTDVQILVVQPHCK